MMKYWHEKYLGIPFKIGGRSFDGCDCAGLVILVYNNELNKIVKDVSEAYSREQFQHRDGRVLLSKFIDECTSQWFEVAMHDIKQFDMVRYAYGSAECHCGIYCGNGYVLHSEEKSLSRLSKIKMNGYKLTRIMRYAE